jgi:hypothetical protein
VGIEARRHARFTANLPIQASTTRGTLVESETGRMLDASERGLCFVGARYLAPGASLKIEFRDCVLECEVKHCRMREYSSHMEFVTGVEVLRVAAGAETWKSLMPVLQ